MVTLLSGDGDSTEPTVPWAIDRDDLADELEDGLYQCLCDALTAVGRPVCVCTRFHGNHQLPWDACDCACGDGKRGQAWTRLVSSSAVPTTYINRALKGSCRVQLRWQLIIELGVVRCIESVGALPASQEQRERDREWARKDRALLWRLGRCCSALRHHSLIAANWLPVGPQGGCAGSVLQLTVDLGDSPSKRRKPVVGSG